METLTISDFDGVFRFTNFSEEDFSARWNSVEYTFPAMKMTPMIISGATPEEVQSIRKKFARELAVREFYKTPRFNALNGANTPTPAIYTDNDLVPLIQRCLEPLEVGTITKVALPKDSEEDYTSVVVDGDEDVETLIAKTKGKGKK